MKREEREKQLQHVQAQHTEEPATLVLTDTTGSLPATTKQALSFASEDEDEYEEDIAHNSYEMPPTYSRNANPSSWTHIRNESSMGGTERGGSAMDWSSPITVGTSGDVPLRPNRRVEYDEEANAESNGRAAESPGRRSQLSNLSKSKWVHPFLKNFRSPIGELILSLSPPSRSLINDWL